MRFQGHSSRPRPAIVRRPCQAHSKSIPDCDRYLTARIETGGLKVLPDRCPQLLHEAELYRYGDAAADKHAEAPVDDHNHALAALRYLVSRLTPWRGCRDEGRGSSSAA